MSDAYKRKAVLFDQFAYECKYFDGESDANNGYGCDHPEQEEKEDDLGCCFCFSCPRGFPADKEDFENKDIDWGDTTVGDVTGGDYLIVESEEAER